MTYVGPDGRVDRIEVAVGDTVMDGALDNNIPGIIGQCGGGCTCCTCHCYVEAVWRPLIPAPDADERVLLAYVLEPGAGSRLACQIKLTDALDGLTVRLPRRQLPEHDTAAEH